MPRYGFGNSYEDQAQAGARTAEEMRVNRIEAAHTALEEARMRRMEAEATSKAQRQTEIHKRMATALPLLFGIKPSDEDAEDRYFKFGANHAADLLEDKGAKEAFEQIGRQLESFKKQKAEIAARTEAAEAAAASRKEMAEQQRQGREDLMKLSQEFKTQTAQNAADAKAKERAQKHQGDFDKAYSTYTGHLKATQDADFSSATPETLKFLTDKNVARVQMQNAADRIKKIDPDAAEDIAEKLKEADLQEHAVLQDKLNKPPADKSAQALLFRDANAVKARLGFDQMKLDEAGQPVLGTDKRVVMLKAPSADQLAELPPATDAQKASNSQFMKAASEAGNAAPVAPTLTPAPANPNLTPPAGVVPAQPIATATDVTPPAPAATSHPMEGKSVRNKQTGSVGKIVNGEFVPD